MKPSTNLQGTKGVDARKHKVDLKGLIAYFLEKRLAEEFHDSDKIVQPMLLESSTAQRQKHLFVNATINKSLGDKRC
jgi:hypothetical protein